MEYILHELSYDEEKELAKTLGLVKIETYGILTSDQENFYSLDREDYCAVMIILETINNCHLSIRIDTTDARRLISTIKSDLRRDDVSEFVIWKQLVLYTMSDIYQSFAANR